jgi:DNA polymerase
MNMTSNSTFLKEMGITEWTSRDLALEPSQAFAAVVSSDETPEIAQSKDRISCGIWWFFGNKPQGEAEILFQNIIRVLGLTPKEWSWKNPLEKLNPELLPQDGSPIVALAFGSSAAQKLTGERDGLEGLRQTILAMNADGAEDLPLIATFELNQLTASPKNKALFWQDLLLAKSVLQNI